MEVMDVATPTDPTHSSMDLTSAPEQQDEFGGIVVPGQRVGHAEDYASGEGTYVRGSHIYASVLGLRRLLSPAEAQQWHEGAAAAALVSTEEPTQSSREHDARSVVVVEKAGGRGLGGGGGGWVPRAGDVVTGVVVRVTPRVAAVNIACVGRRALPETFSGIVRSQDVRATSTEQVELYKAFRPGDVVRAEVLSLGDARSYFLSTGRNDLGVVSATHSVSGAAMVPLSWNLMMCPKTNMTEPRKVAKLTP
jgi:exosome complex component CSL4